MASDDSSGSRPGAPIVLRIKLRYNDVEAMVQRFATNVGKSGLFLPTRSLQPIGAEIKFELRLADDTAVLVGLGRVKAANPPDPHHPRAAFGMAIELMRVTPQSRALILRMLERRRELGLPELGLPMASDIDAARRSDGGDLGGRDVASGPVPVVMPPAPPAPVVPAPVDVPAGEALLTAPRRTTGPMVAAKVLAVAALAPEPPRKRRLAVSEVIESASGPVASVYAAVPGLDDDVDMAATLSRARTLAGGALDAELEALYEVAAAPVEISIDAASAELARQLGGSAVRRDRTAGWAPPPATAVATPAPSPGGEPEEPGPEIKPEEPGPEIKPEEPGPEIKPEEPGPEIKPEEPGPEIEPEEPGPEIEPEEPGPEIEPEEPGPEIEPQEPEIAPAVEAISAAIAAAIADHVGAHPVAGSGLDVEDADRAAEDGHGDHRGRRARSFAPPHVEQIPTEPSGPFAVHGADPGVAAALEELDADEHTELGEMPVASSGFELPAASAEDRDPLAGGPPLMLGADEFDDFEILAEADADDEDLLASDGEHDASNRRELHVRPRTGERHPSELDFAARLDLGDESDPYAASRSDEFSARHVIDGLSDELTGEHAVPGAGFAGVPRSGDLHFDTAGAALALFETGDEPLDDADDHGRLGPQVVQPIFDPDPSSSFTIAGIPSDSMDLDVSPRIRGDAGASGRAARRSGSAGRAEAPVGHRIVRSLHEGPVEDHELEHALEALDVDLDDLAASHAATQLPRDRPRSTSVTRPAGSRASVPQPRMPAPAPQSRAPAATPSRAVRHPGYGAPGFGRSDAPGGDSEDSVEIEIDDDD